MISGVSEVNVQVCDQDVALEFWTNRVGFDLARDTTFGDERWIELTPPAGAPRIVLGPRAEDDPGPTAADEHAQSPVFFTCDDINATYRELRDRGIDFPRRPFRCTSAYGQCSLTRTARATRSASPADTAASPHHPCRPDEENLRIVDDARTPRAMQRRSLDNRPDHDHRLRFVPVRDVNAARRFCEDVLGLERSVDYERRDAEFETGKLTLQDPNGHAWILHHCHAPRA